DNRSAAEKLGDRIRTGAQRETVEAFVVAFILALLFRAFVAEAFVIPTGSMAPTLMGAHKDIECDQCGTQFQVGASLERRAYQADRVVVGGICPNCRRANRLDLVNEVDDATFSGDRILVSKFAYTIEEPERWDVIVFKFPGNPKQNYIKRLVGLPNETLTLRHGDVFVRPTDDDSQRSQIARKPPDKLLAMRHLVHDTQHQAKLLLQANYPSRWQPWQPGSEQPTAEGWDIVSNEEGMTATADATSGDRWLRYFHRWPDDKQWAMAERGQSLESVDPFDSGLITDYYAYGSYTFVPSKFVYAEPPRQSGSSLFGSGYSRGRFRPSYDSGGSYAQFGEVTVNSSGLGRDGMHWVGDLILEANVELGRDAKDMTLELVESGVTYRAGFDLADGTVSLSIADGQEAESFDSLDGKANVTPMATTGQLRGGRHNIRFSNCDDQLLVWVDGSVLSFDQPTTFDSRRYRPQRDNYPRFNTVGDPLDAAPVAIRFQGGKSTVHHLRLDRDKYYIATKNSNNGVYDYNPNVLFDLTGRVVGMREVQMILGDRTLWPRFQGWDSRRTVEYTLQEDQFFPMGDNSPESLDARCWKGSRSRSPRIVALDEDAYLWDQADYVPRDLLVGKALVVFWPHPWSSPVPFTPNFSRMGLIR
ncbi:MAG: signal peptidase I, partial [Planctomycetota bacterium]